MIRFTYTALNTFLISSVSFASIPSPMPFSLDDYLLQVQSQNQNIKASMKSHQGSLLRANEGSLIVKPTFFGSFSKYNDPSTKAAPSTLGTNTLLDTYSAGILENTIFGLTAKLTYTTTYTAIEGANPTLLTAPMTFQSKPTLELSQSLWRNFFGKEIRATLTLTEASAMANAELERYKIKLAIAEAESTYWRLSLVRDLKRVQQESLDRAEKIKNWTGNRVKLRLADQSDLLQAEAIVKVRTLEHQATIDEERSASLAFNSLRERTGAEIEEQVQPLSTFSIDSIEIPKRAERRGDVEQLYQLTRVSDASNRLSREKYLPSLDLFGNLSTSGTRYRFEDAFKDSLSLEKPITTVGVRLSIPLDQATVSKTRDGYRMETEGADLRLSRRYFEQEKEWTDLTKRFEEAKRRLSILLESEEIQKQKYLREKDRHAHGRTTTYFVLLFEQDYNSSQAARLRTQSEILTLFAQMKTFGE